jgi:hypothetical protein
MNCILRRVDDCDSSSQLLCISKIEPLEWYLGFIGGCQASLYIPRHESAHGLYTDLARGIYTDFYGVRRNDRPEIF